MLRPFALNRSIGPDSTMDLNDVLTTKRALHRIGAMPIPTYGLTPYPDQAMIDGLRTFQRRAGLRVDGVMRPDGPTAAKLGEEVAARRNATTPADRSTYPGTHAPSESGQRNPAASRQPIVPINEAPGPGSPFPTHTRPWKPQTPHSNDSKVAQLAAPFVYWLMSLLGVGTAAMAMQIFRTLGPVRQQQLRDQFEHEEEYPKGYCLERWLEERDRCNDRDPMWIGPCKDRARDRFGLCVNYGGRPDPDEPGEWSTKDEEIWRRD